MAAELTIGEFARRCGLSASSLRFYDECELLPPAGVDPSSSYRFYEEAQLATAALIRDLRSLGMGIAAIRDVLQKPASVKHKAIDDQVAALAHFLNDARRLARVVHHRIEELETEMAGMTVAGSDLGEAIAQVLPAVGADPERAVLRGVLIEGRDGSLRLVATDSYRLALRDLVPESGGSDNFRALVAGGELGAVADWLAAQPSVALEASNGRLAFRSGGDERALATMIETYPDYEPLLSVAADAHPLIVARDEFCSALDEFASKKYVRLAFDPDQLTVTSGTTTRRLPALYEGPGVSVAFNPAYALDAVSAAVGPDIVIEATDPTNAVMFRSADEGTFTSMLMPILVG